MHDNVLILHDGGPDFMRTVRLAALYAEKVHVYSPIQQSTIDSINDWIGLLDIDESDLQQLPPDADLMRHFPGGVSDVKGFIEYMQEQSRNSADQLYLRQCIANQTELATLARESVVVSLFDETLPRIFRGSPELHTAMDDFKNSVMAMDKSLLPKFSIPKSFLAGSAESVPNVCSLFAIGFELFIEYADAVGMPTEKVDEIAKAIDDNEDLPNQFSAGLLFLLSTAYAVQNNCAGMTWDVEVQQFFDACSDAFSTDPPAHNPLIRRQKQIRHLLGATILEEEVPDVSTLPLDELLSIRSQRAPELMRFRATIDAIATNIDPNLSPQELQLAISNQIATAIKPALIELQQSVEEQRRKAWVQLGRPDESLVKGGVLFAISANAGMSLPLSAAVGAISVLAKKLYDFTIGVRHQEQTILRANPWSVLFHLKKRSK